MSEQLSLLSPTLDDSTARRLGLQRTREVKRPRLSLIDVPRAAKADPDTSHLAAARIKASGALNRQQQRVCDFVEIHKGFTSAELAKSYASVHSGIWQQHRPMFGRRLPELEGVHIHKGEPRVCRVTGSPCVTWWPL